MNIGFDNQKYLQMQSAHIRERISMFGDKLYLEFVGKLFDDYHAARVLPGFEPDSKLKMLLQLKDQAEIVIAISASALETNKTRRDLGLTYDLEVLRLTEAFRNIGLYVGSVASHVDAHIRRGLVRTFTHDFFKNSAQNRENLNVAVVVDGGNAVSFQMERVDHVDVV